MLTDETNKDTLINKADTDVDGHGKTHTNKQDKPTVDRQGKTCCEIRHNDRETDVDKTALTW